MSCGYFLVLFVHVDDDASGLPAPDPLLRLVDDLRRDDFLALGPVAPNFVGHDLGCRLAKDGM